MIHAVIFDLDGTLVHSLPGIAASTNRVLENHDLPIHTESTVRTYIGNGIIKLAERATPARFDQPTIEQLADEISSDYAATWKNGTSPYLGIKKVLAKLMDKNISLAVFSNKPHVFCKEITDLLFPEIHFTSVIGQRDDVPVKPDPTGALEVAKSLAIEPRNIAFVGDSTIDLATARNAGMLSIAATWGYHDLPALEAASPDHLINKIDDLLTII